MRLCTYSRNDNAPRAGLAVENGIIDIALASAALGTPLPASVRGVLEAGPQALDRKSVV